MNRYRRMLISTGMAILGTALIWATIATTAITPRPVSAQGPTPIVPRSAKGLEIVGHNDLQQLQGNTSEVWYAKGIAYVGYRCGHTRNITDAKGTSFVDVRDPANPKVLFVTQPMSGTFADDVWGVPDMNTPTFKGDLLVEPHDWCTRRAAAATRFWDVTNPAQPVLLSTLVTGDGVHNVYAFKRMDGGMEKVYVILAAPNADLNDNTQNGYEDIDLDADFAIVDATDPRNPKIVSKFNSHQTWNNLPATTFQHDTWANKAGTIAYGAYWDAGMIMLDISDITNIKPISRFGYSDKAEGNTHGVILTKNEDYAVLTDEDFDPTDSAFQVLEPASLAGTKRSSIMGNANGTVEGELVWVGRGCDADPNYMLAQPDPYLHDATGKIAVIVRGTCSFVGKLEQAQLHGAIGAIIVNNTAGAGPPPLGGQQVRMGTTILGAGLSLEDGYVITTTLEASTTVKARFGIRGGEWGYTRFVDIHDPLNPKQVAEYTIPETRQYPPPADEFIGFSVHNSTIRGDKLYLSHYDAGVRVVDVTDPTKPKELAYLDPPDRKLPDGTSVRASIWGIITDENGYIYASDMNNGLWILRESTGIAVTDVPPTTAPPTTVAPTIVPATAIPPAAPTRTAIPQTAVPPQPTQEDHVCSRVLNQVPRAAIDAALANPSSIAGYNQLTNPARPESPFNRRKVWLTLHNYSVPYHPFYNALEYRAGCP